jgi:hypothetical protein
MHYKSPENRLHDDMDGTATHLLPAGCVPITDDEAQALRPKPPSPTYQQLRAPLYPLVTDGLDAIVKGGQAWEDYKAACLAVKASVPKPKA